MDGNYPVQLSIDYPDRALDRTTTFFRFFVALPILVVLGGVSGGVWRYTYENGTAGSRDDHGGSTETSSSSGSRTGWWRAWP